MEGCLLCNLALQDIIQTKCFLPVVEYVGFQSNQISPTNFSNQHAFNQTERSKLVESARVEFGFILNMHIFQGTGVDTTS